VQLDAESYRPEKLSEITINLQMQTGLLIVCFSDIK